MGNYLKIYCKKIFSDLHSAVIGIIVSILFLSVGGILVFSKTLWGFIKELMLLPTPLWVTIALLFLSILVYILIRIKNTIPLSIPDPEYHEELHVYWDENYNMKCLNCGKPLKPGSDNDSSKFFCVDPRCNSKHILKTKQGNKITEQQAIDIIKNIRKGTEVGPRKTP